MGEAEDELLNVGWGEMAVIMVVALVVFGPNRLPEIARSMGKFVRNFQRETSRALNDLKEGMEPIGSAGIFDEPDFDLDAEDVGPEPAPPPAATTTPAPARRKTSTRPARRMSARRPKKASKKTPARTTASSRRASGTKKPRRRA
jgi:sec-independent protein translocase protein TatB